MNCYCAFKFLIGLKSFKERREKITVDETLDVTAPINGQKHSENEPIDNRLSFSECPSCCLIGRNEKKVLFRK